MSSVNPADPRRGAPAVDARLIAPESRYEVDDGRVVYVSPADEPHGSRHSKLSALLEAHAAEDYDVASDMLTRTSESDDMAPDASVFPSERDPTTGGRQLEELAFEVVSTERLSDAAHKAGKLAGRGVRRVFALDVARRRAFEWSRETNAWQILHPGSNIEDPALAVALPVDALVHAAKADDAMAAALLAKRNPILQAALADSEARGQAKGEIRGEAKGRAEALIMILKVRGLEPSPSEAAHILATKDLKTLEAWLVNAQQCRSVAELISKPDR